MNNIYVFNLETKHGNTSFKYIIELYMSRLFSLFKLKKNFTTLYYKKNLFIMVQNTKKCIENKYNKTKGY
jgi:hypothetical protein